MQVNNKSKLQNRILVALIVIGVMVLALIALLRINVFGVKVTRVYEYQESGFVSWLDLTKTEFYGDDTMKLYGITDENLFNNAVFYDKDFNVLEGDYSVSYEDNIYTINAEFASRVNHISLKNGDVEFRYLCSEQYALKDWTIVLDADSYYSYYGAEYFTEEEKAVIQEREQRIADKYASLVGCFESADGDRIYFSDIDGEKHMELVYSDGIGYGADIIYTTEDERDPNKYILRSAYRHNWVMAEYNIRFVQSDSEVLTIEGPFGGEYKKISDVNEKVFQDNCGILAGKWKRIDDRSEVNGLEYIDYVEFADGDIKYSGENMSDITQIDVMGCRNDYKLYEGRKRDYDREEDYTYYVCFAHLDGGLVYITLSEDNNVMIYERCTEGDLRPFATLMFERE